VIQEQSPYTLGITNKTGAQVMKQIQKWFELIAGISQEERVREELAREIFYGSPLDIESMRTPACWRRKCRVTI
jgi:hypothetical protein